MKQSHEFCPSDRYRYDFGLCSVSNGFAQIDTSQDAHYYGNWTNPEKRITFSYVEGDCTTTECESDQEYVEHIHDFAKWSTEMGYGFKLDPGLGPEIKAKFVALGLDEYLH